jgi:dipeptidyl aminopeptidase/acylaminoacyl peptidase
VKPSDLAQIRVPGTPTLSPDGRLAVVSLRGIDLDADDYTSQLWLLSPDGSSPPRRLTHGWQDTSPAISPDGRWLAFVRAVRDASGDARAGLRSGRDGSGGGRSGRDGDREDARAGKPQLWIMPMDGGEAHPLSDHPLGVLGPVAWSPDSTRLGYVARVPEPDRYGSIPPDREPPRRITELSYRLDGVGFTGDRRRHLYVVDALAADAEPVRITDGDFDHSELDWSPDGTLVTFVSARHDTRGADVVTDVWVCRPDGTGLRALTDGGRGYRQPRFSPDGDTIFVVGFDADGLGPVCANDGLWAVGVSGDTVRRLTDQERYGLPREGEIVITPAGVLFLNENRGAVELLRMPLVGGEPTVLVGGARQVLGVASAGGRTVAAVADPTTWGEVATVTEDGLAPLTDWSTGGVEVHPLTEINTSAPDGYPVHGWVVRPAGDGPHPVLLMIHGGPFAQYGWRRFDEAQVYADGGYAVVMGNPRGSSGYGESHGRAVVGDVGARSAVDLLALLDAALAAPDLDATRVGVLGGSHGGFMTTWLAAHHGDRFKAAVSERAVDAIDSFIGSSDIGWYFGERLYGPDPAQRHRQSPLTHADRIDIPMLIIHSEQDWRCPVEQAQRLFVALKLRDVPVELLLFPGEGHGLSREGLPSHRVARFEAVLDWWRRWL